MPRSPLLLGSSNERERAMRAAAARVVIGGALTLLPGLSRRTFGIPASQDNAALRLMARLFGIRNVLLGVWAIRVQDQGPDARRLCYQVNAAADALDVVALAVAGVTGDGLVRGALMGGALGTSEVLAWFDLLGDVDGPQEPQGSVSLA
ncbi:MAG: hypothetical protein M3010_02670 [Candidatus Dormibacteraeota bacterium]|nr:hypothetical protein [Candidatus Dormibacteraeota bacterium]